MKLTANVQRGLERALNKELNVTTRSMRATRTVYVEIASPYLSMYRKLILLNSIEHNYSSPLLSLPPEIHTMIYKHALGGMTIRPYSEDPADTTLIVDGKVCEVSAGSYFSLPLVCRQIYAELHNFVYSLNTFSFMSCLPSDKNSLVEPNNRNSWVSMRTEEQMSAVRSVMVESKRMMREMFFGKDRATSNNNTFPNLKDVLINLAFLEYEEYLKLWGGEKFKARQVSTDIELGGEWCMRW